jgi:hypothetical protein
MFKEMRWEGLDWIRLSQDRELLWTFLNTLMTLQVRVEFRD